MDKPIWTEAEVEYLKINYSSTHYQELSNHLNKSSIAISTKAGRLGIKKDMMIYKHHGTRILLDESLQSLYWMGFILADGNLFYNRLTIKLSIKDVAHLQKFVDYIKAPNSIKIYKALCNFTGRETTKAYFCTSNIEIITELAAKFDINSNKTYHPPIIENYKLSAEQFNSLLLGFIDGDGSINPTGAKLKTGEKRYYVNIGVHASWRDNIIFLKRTLYDHYDMYKTGYDGDVSSHVYDKRGGLRISIGKFKVLQELKRFALINNLPILERKWNKIIL